MDDRSVDEAKAVVVKVVGDVHFTTAELAILSTLVDNLDVYIPIADILSGTRIHALAGTSSLKVHVTNIRKKLKNTDSNGFAILRRKNSYALYRIKNVIYNI